MRYTLFLFILLSGSLYGQSVPFKQLPRGSNNTQIPVTRGANNIMDFRDAESFLIDSLGLLNECCFDSIYQNQDSILLRDGTGYVILKDTSSTNEIELPSQTGNSGKYLTTNGTDPSWATMPSGEATTVGDTPTIDLTLTGVNITAKADTSLLATKYDLTLITGGMDSTYNGVRVVQRIPVAGSTNLNANTFREWLDWWYQKNYQAPTLTFNSISPTVVEVGTSTTYTLSGSTSNPCVFTLASGAISSPSGYSFGSATSFSTSYTHLPSTAGTTTLTASQGWTMTTGSCEAGSPTTGTASASRTISNVYPILWGMSASDWSGGGSIPYSSFTQTEADNFELHKRVATESNLTGLKMYGTNMYIYILIPKSWSDWTATSIIDHNNFNVTASFTGYDVNVTSTGLTNNWTQAYRMYKLNSLTTASNYSYSYNR